MSDAMPCPVCGSDQVQGEAACRVCGFVHGATPPSNAGAEKCARWGSGMPVQYDFCPVCGLDQRRRFRRPSTDAFSLQPPRQPAAPPSSAANAPVSDGRMSAPQASSMAGFVPVGSAQPAAAVAATPRPAHQLPTPAPVPNLGQYDTVEPQPASAYLAPGPQQAPVGFGPTPVASTSAWQQNARLVLVRRDGSDGQRYPIVGQTIGIGRDSGEVQFPHDAFLSPLHARVERVGATFVVVDLASRNGVYLRIHGTEPVYPGDQFLVGHQLLRLENLGDGEQERDADAAGTRAFGSPIERAWGKVQLIGGGGASGDTFYLRGTDVVFGREQGDVIFPHDAFLSRKHASLRMHMTPQGMSVMLEDYKSANGTYLRVRGRAEVSPGDTFRVGDQILRVDLD